MSDPTINPQQPNRPAPHPQVTNVYVQQRPALPPKSITVAYLLMLFSLIGISGIQHFYQGKIGRGILWILTMGIFGIGLIVDLFTLPSQVKTINARRAVGIG
jgi:hypothetical protein